MADQMQNAVGKGFGLVMDSIYNSLIGKGPASALRKKDLTKFSAEDLWALANVIPGGTGKVVKEAAAITPAGAKAVASTLAATRRTIPQQGLELVNPALRKQSEASAVYGPGTYFAENKAANFTRWGSQYGNQLNKATLTPKAALDIAQSKGYMSLDDFKAAAAKAGQPDIAKLQMSDPIMQDLVKQGYVGMKYPGDKVVTNWVTGSQKGMGLKKIADLNPSTSNYEKPNALQSIQNKMRDAVGYSGQMSQFMSPSQITKKAAELAKQKAIAKLTGKSKPKTYKPQIEG